MKVYHTYDAVEVAFTLLKYASMEGKSFTNLQLQKLVYVSHGLSLSHYDRPLIVQDVCAWQYGPVIPAVYFKFQSFGSDEVTDSCAVEMDEQSEGIVKDVVSKLGHLTGSQLVELTHREGSPWHQVWDESRYKVIPDQVIKNHYLEIKRTGRTSCL